MQPQRSSYVSSAMVACLVSALGARAHGLGLERLAGVDDIAALRDPTVRLPNGADDAIFAQTAQRLHMPWLGLWFACEVAHEGAFGALGYLARHAPDLSAALARVVRYGRLFCSGEPTEVRISSQRVRIVEGATTAPFWSPVMGDAVMATWLTLIRRFTQTAITPTRVELAYPRPADASHHEALFGAEPRFEARAFALEFPSAVLQCRFKDVDLILGATLERQAQELLGMAASEGVLVRRIHALMQTGELELEGVAHALAMHPRTLQRRLAAEGLAWRAVRDGFRKELAQRQLNTPGVSLKKVAALAGFADVTSFRRAYRRWTGQAPGTAPGSAAL